MFLFSDLRAAFINNLWEILSRSQCCLPFHTGNREGVQQTVPISAGPQRLRTPMTHFKKKKTKQFALGSAGSPGWDFPEATSTMASPAFLMWEFCYSSWIHQKFQDMERGWPFLKCLWQRKGEWGWEWKSKKSRKREQELKSVKKSRLVFRMNLWKEKWRINELKGEKRVTRK